MSPIIKLNERETELAMSEGKRMVETFGYTDDGGFTVNGKVLDFFRIGYAAEIAVAKYIGEKWTGASFLTRHKGDVEGIEVRASKQNNCGLILNERDIEKKDRKFMLVQLLGNQEFKMLGWLYGHEVIIDEFIFKRDQFKEKIWRVGQEQLREMCTL